MEEPTIDRAAFHTLSCGLYIVSSIDSEGHACGCVINTLLQVTSEPPQLLIAINKENATCKAIEQSCRFCASVLSQHATMDLIGPFGFKSSYDIDKFAACAVETDTHGVPCIMQDTVAVFSLKVVERVDVGTHYLFIAAVEQAMLLSNDKPLTYDYYHNVIKGGTPPKASSFDPSNTRDAQAQNHEEIALDETPSIGWKCALCGRIIEGYPDGLPEDFKCPVCGVGREFFTKVEL